MATPLPPSFLAKKKRILSQLAIPAAEYDDQSPKGSVDEGIRVLIDEINGIEGCVTTSSCAGRVSVFLEGRRKVGVVEDEEGEGEGREKSAGIGGKGGGGRWLYVSHEIIPVRKEEGKSWVEILGMRSGDVQSMGEGMGDVLERRLIHFKFEPMVCYSFFKTLVSYLFTFIDSSRFNCIFAGSAESHFGCFTSWFSRVGGFESHFVYSGTCNSYGWDSYHGFDCRVCGWLREGWGGDLYGS